MMNTAPMSPSPLETWPPAWEPAAVVFDCDGLLVDTESQWVQVQDDYLAQHGVSLDPEVRRRITGRAAEVVVVAVAERVGKDPHVVGTELLERHRADTSRVLTPFPGALETLRAVAARKPTAIASNSPRDLLDHKLETLGIQGVAHVTIAIEDATAPKPAPDMYLAAARALGADPADCLGFEDSETGAEAALAAGLHLIVVPSIPGQDPPAPRRLSTLEDPVLSSWIAGWESTR